MSILERVGVWLDQKYADDRAVVMRMDSWIETEQLLKRYMKNLCVPGIFTVVDVAAIVLAFGGGGDADMKAKALIGLLCCSMLIGKFVKDGRYLFAGWRRSYIRIEAPDVIWICNTDGKEDPLRVQQITKIDQSQSSGKYSIEGRYGAYDCRLLNMMRNSAVDSMLAKRSDELAHATKS